MKRRLLLILMIILSSLPLIADEASEGTDSYATQTWKEQWDPLAVSFTSNISAISGFSKKVISETIALAEDVYDDGETLQFQYNPSTGMFYIDELYYFVQVFTRVPLVITLTATPLSHDSVNIGWKSTESKYGDTVLDTSNGSGSIVIDESSISDIEFNQPRVYSDQIQIQIPSSELEGVDRSNNYAGTITLQVKTK